MTEDIFFIIVCKTLMFSLSWFGGKAKGGETYLVELYEIHEMEISFRNEEDCIIKKLFLRQSRTAKGCLPFCNLNYSINFSLDFMKNETFTLQCE